jgi:hypothetical protein
VKYVIINRKLVVGLMTKLSLSPLRIEKSSIGSETVLPIYRSEAPSKIYMLIRSIYLGQVLEKTV